MEVAVLQITLKMDLLWFQVQQSCWAYLISSPHFIDQLQHLSNIFQTIACLVAKRFPLWPVLLKA